MIEPSNADLSIGKQCKLLSISRSSFYYEPKGESEMNLNLNRPLFVGDPEVRILGHGKDEERNTLSRGTAHQSGAYGFGSRERIREQIGSDIVDFAEGWMQQGQLAYLGKAV